MLQLHENEKHLHSFRRHPIVLLPPLFVLVILALAPLVADYIVQFSLEEYVIGNATALFTFLYVAWLLILWLAFSAAFVDYWLDIWVVTDKRLMDYEQRGLFHRHIAITKLEHIQDISIEVNGLLATFFDFGDIHVQTAGTDKEFVLKGIARPRFVKRAISEISN